jgi:Arc/MetJ-type ribon-helix-helix transcriptional regulator
MNVHLPEDLQRYVQSEVQCGHFASEQDAIEEAVRLLRQRQLSHGLKPPPADAVAKTPDPVLGAMRDAADEMDEIVAEAMTHREQQPWRLPTT